MNPSFALVRLKRLQTNPNVKWNNLSLRQSPSGRSLVIGREMDCDLRIESIDVSRRHAMLELIGDQWHVTDLESTNGLYKNDKRLDPMMAYPLKNGDRLSIGPSNRSKLVYEFVEDFNYSVPTKRKRETSDAKESLAAKKFRNEWKDLFDLELSCSICHELFVSPVNLNCAHTFCESCIEQWKRSQNNGSNEEDSSQEEPEVNCCPICRQPIVSQNRVLALDNVIDYILKNWTPSLLKRRNQLVKERQSVATEGSKH